MILDNLLLFTGTSNGATSTIADSANTDAPTTGTQLSSNILDIGIKNGLPASAVNGGGARDLGIGDDPMLKLLVRVTTTFVYGAGSGTLQVLLEGAPDAGSNTPGSYTQMWESAALAQTLMIAGADIANVDVPRVIPGQALPRYLRLTFITAVATWTAGSVEAAIVVDRDDAIVGITGARSGYPAGIVVNN